MDVGVDQAGNRPQSLAVDGCAIWRSLGVRLCSGINAGEGIVLNEDRRVLFGRGAGGVDEGYVCDE